MTVDMYCIIHYLMYVWQYENNNCFQFADSTKWTYIHFYWISYMDIVVLCSHWIKDKVKSTNHYRKMLLSSPAPLCLFHTRLCLFLIPDQMSLWRLNVHLCKSYCMCRLIAYKTAKLQGETSGIVTIVVFPLHLKLPVLSHATLYIALSELADRFTLWHLSRKQPAVYCGAVYLTLAVAFILFHASLFPLMSLRCVSTWILNGVLVLDPMLQSLVAWSGPFLCICVSFSFSKNKIQLS